MCHLYVLYFMKLHSTCVCGMNIFIENQKYCSMCVRDREWEVFLKPKKQTKKPDEKPKDRMEVEKSIAKLTHSLKLARDELKAIKKREKEEERMENDQQELIRKFQMDLPNLQKKIRKKILA